MTARILNLTKQDDVPAMIAELLHLPQDQTMKIRLIGGKAHGHVAILTTAQPVIDVTMINGIPEIIYDTSAPDARELLDQAHGTWEEYTFLDNLTPDSYGRHGYYCTKPLPARPSDLPDPTLSRTRCQRLVSDFLTATLKPPRGIPPAEKVPIHEISELLWAQLGVAFHDYDLDQSS